MRVKYLDESCTVTAAKRDLDFRERRQFLCPAGRKTVGKHFQDDRDDLRIRLSLDHVIVKVLDLQIGAVEYMGMDIDRKRRVRIANRGITGAERDDG